MAAIFLREWRKLFKQPRLIAITFLLPGCMILLMMGFLFSDLIKEDDQTIAVVTDCKEAFSLVAEDARYHGFETYTRMTPQLTDAYDKGRVAAVIRMDRGLSKAQITYDATKLLSNQSLMLAQDFVKDLQIRMAGKALYGAYLQEQPELVSVDTGTKKEVWASNFRLLVSVCTAVLLFLTGQPVITFALDAYLGERERGTYDSIRLGGITVVQFLAGKFLFVLSVAVPAALAQTAALAFGVSRFAGDMGIAHAIENRAAFCSTAFLALFAGLSVLISAMLYLSAYFDSLKEASMYAGVGVLLFAGLTQLGSLTKSGAVKWLPIANMNWLIQENAAGAGRYSELAVSVFLGVLLAAVFLKLSAEKLKAREN